MICFRSITKSVARFAFYAMNTVVGEIVGAFRARSFVERNSLHRKTSRLRQATTLARASVAVHDGRRV